MSAVIRIIFFIGFLACPAAAQEDDEPIIIEEDLDGPTGLDGTIRLSSGEVLRGKISLPGEKRIRMYDLRLRRTFYLKLQEIAAIRTLVESEGMEDAWTFEEEGFRRKVQLGYKYPLRNYLQEFELSGGNLVVGHIIATPVYLNDGKKEHRFKLLRQEKGKRGQTISDLVYPESIEFTGEKAPRRAFASLAGTVPGLNAAAVVERKTLRGAAGKVQPSGSFRIEGLLPGPYLAFLRVGNTVKIGLPRELHLTPVERKAVEKRLQSLEEFFDQKRMVLLSGSRERLWLLVELTRSGGTTLSDETGKSYRFRRWEVWILRARGREESGEPWHIESRVFLDRMVVPSRERIPPCTYQADEGLEKLILNPGENRLR